MLRWYLVQRYEYVANNVLLMDPIDGVYCSNIGVAYDRACQRNTLKPNQRFRIYAAVTARERKLAKELSLRWGMDEFIEFMQLPTYRGKVK